MKRFAYIVHYPSYREFARESVSDSGDDACGRMEPDVIKEFIWESAPRVWFRVTRVQSINGDVADGIVIMCPFVPEHIATQGEPAVLRKLHVAAEIAVREGARIIGLAGFASVIGDEGAWLAKRLTIPVTSGNTYTASLVVDGVRRAARERNIDLSASTMAIVGATGDIGSACSRVFNREVSTLRLVVRGNRGVEYANGAFCGTNGRVQISRSVREAVRNANVIVTATSAITTLIEPEDVIQGCVICDVAVPHNVAENIVEVRPDVFAFEGGLAALPMEVEVDQPRWWSELCADGKTIFGCLAEVILLALERRWVSYSLGRGKISKESIDDIRSIAVKHGFGLGGFRYNGRSVEMPSSL